MCSGPGRAKSASSLSTSTESEISSISKNMNNLAVETEGLLSSLLELAANNDAHEFKRLIELDASSINDVGLWYGRKKGSKQIALEHRTPLMVAATYGSIEVLRLILHMPEADVNISCGLDGSTALHCAACGGSSNAIDVVKLLLLAGADPKSVDANGHRPVDVVVVPPKLQSMRVSLEELLSNSFSSGNCKLLAPVDTSGSNSPTLSFSTPGNESPNSPLDSVSSPKVSKLNDVRANTLSEKKEYPIDPSLPDIKNSIYATDEFRMFSFKVRPCSRAYSHDWTECPFVHPGENARRRDPRKYHYSCVPCPDFRKGACRRGDMCEYAHGVFECWLHPAQYRTRLCKDGTNCARRVCFFAHTSEELRPLYVSTGSAVPSPRSAASTASAMDLAAAMSLLPGSPSAASAMSPNPFNQQMSPSGNGMPHSTMAWPQPNVPTLHLPGSNLQSSRLRSSLNARDFLPEDLKMLADIDVQHQLLNDFGCYSQARPNSASMSRLARIKTLAPSNLDELFSAEFSSSPRYSDPASVFSPSHKCAVRNQQLQQQQQQQPSMLSPINTTVFSPKNAEHSMLQASFGAASPGMMSPRSVEPLSPMSSRLSVLPQHEQHQQQQMRSLSARELGCQNPIVGSPRFNWGSPNGKADWSVNGDEMGRLKRSSSFELQSNGDEPDLSWVQSLVKESPPEMLREKLVVPMPSAPASSGGDLDSSAQIESVDHSVIGAWLEQMQLDQLVA